MRTDAVRPASRPVSATSRSSASRSPAASTAKRGSFSEPMRRPRAAPVAASAMPSAGEATPAAARKEKKSQARGFRSPARQDCATPASHARKAVRFSAGASAPAAMPRRCISPSGEKKGVAKTWNPEGALPSNVCAQASASFALAASGATGVSALPFPCRSGTTLCSETPAAAPASRQSAEADESESAP
ncbi:MAG: hypothetical protein ACFWTZ_09730 [Burkholderia sp.]